MKNSKMPWVLILVLAVSLAVAGKGLAQTPDTITLNNINLSQSGIPGATISYSVTVTNNGVSDATVELSEGGSHKWPTYYSPAGPINLQVGASQNFSILCADPF